MALSMRALARECLKVKGAISARRDILALNPFPPPRSLRREMLSIRRTRCRPAGPSNLRVSAVADRKISVVWVDQSDNEDGFSIRFHGRRADSVDHTGSKSVTENAQGATLTDLRSGHEYTISVVAFNAAGESQSSNNVFATTPARSISVSKEGAGASTVFVVTGAGFTPSSLVIIQVTDAQLLQAHFPETAGGDGKFVSRHSLPCTSGFQVTFTAFEDADPLGTLANAIVTTCP